VLNTSVIELWLSNKPSHVNWSKNSTGVLCLVKDLKNESHYFRLYNLNVTIYIIFIFKIYSINIFIKIGKFIMGK
jgi:hypothetical protein